MFTSEEPTRFGIGCLGSRALAGIDAARGDGVRSRTPTALAFDEVRRAAGFQGELAGVRLPDADISPHSSSCISNKGPLLEQAGMPIGIVTAIAAPAALRVTWKGEGGMPAQC